MEMGVQFDRIILSREWLTYDWVMPMHPYMKDYNPFYDSITYINIIEKVSNYPAMERPFSLRDFLYEIFHWLLDLLMAGFLH
jgi:hypothetical protein